MGGGTVEEIGTSKQMSRKMKEKKITMLNCLLPGGSTLLYKGEEEDKKKKKGRGGEVNERRRK